MTDEQREIQETKMRNTANRLSSEVNSGEKLNMKKGSGDYAIVTSIVEKELKKVMSDYNIRHRNRITATINYYEKKIASLKETIKELKKKKCKGCTVFLGKGQTYQEYRAGYCEICFGRRHITKKRIRNY